MKFYEIKLNVVIDRNPPQAIKHLRSALEAIFEKNRHLNRGNMNLVSIEEKKIKWIDFNEIYLRIVSQSIFNFLKFIGSPFEIT